MAELLEQLLEKLLISIIVKAKLMVLLFNIQKNPFKINNKVVNSEKRCYNIFS